MLSRIVFVMPNTKYRQFVTINAQSTRMFMKKKTENSLVARVEDLPVFSQPLPAAALVISILYSNFCILVMLYLMTCTALVVNLTLKLGGSSLRLGVSSPEYVLPEDQFCLRVFLEYKYQDNDFSRILKKNVSAGNDQLKKKFVCNFSVHLIVHWKHLFIKFKCSILSYSILKLNFRLNLSFSPRQGIYSALFINCYPKCSVSE